jgi:hypothetical protein
MLPMCMYACTCDLSGLIAACADISDMQYVLSTASVQSRVLLLLLLLGHDCAGGFLGDDAPVPEALGADVVGGKVAVTMTEGGTPSRPGSKRPADSGSRDRSPKRVKTEEDEQGHPPGPGAAPDTGLPTGHEGKGLVAVMEVSKPEGRIGELVVGPMRVHQRVIFGRLPSSDIVVEHGSLSRQHAALSVEGTGILMLADLQSGEAEVRWKEGQAARAGQQACTTCLCPLCLCVLLLRICSPSNALVCMHCSSWHQCGWDLA